MKTQASLSIACRRLPRLAGAVLLAGTCCTAGARSGQAPPPAAAAAAAAASRIEPADLLRLRIAGDPQLSPDGRRVLFTVECADRAGPPYTRLWSADPQGGQAAPWGGAEGVEGSLPRWSPDGRQVVFRQADRLLVAAADGTGATPLATMLDTNTPLPRVGERIAWSPDGRRVAFVSATAGPEPEMEADPIVITRYQYRPARGWPQRFIDNRRLHVFIAEVATRQVRQLTSGDRSEHSIDWSPDGRRILFLSNHQADPDFVFNYDIFTAEVDGGRIRRLTDTANNEFAPRWSPDGRTIAYLGLKRPLTSSETNMEDTHVWTLDVASGQRRELGAVVDNPQQRLQWSPDGRWLYFTVASRGDEGVYRLPAAGGNAERVGPQADVHGSVRAFAVRADGAVVAAMATPLDPGQLYAFAVDGGKPRPLTALNDAVLAGKRIAATESFTFPSYDGLQIEAFLTRPAALQADARARHPMIVEIHGGPHGQQGPAFNHKAQVFAAAGYAVLMVNYRGSNGYGQAFANAIARDQNGGEAMDVLHGVDAALARYRWLDRERLGVEGASYGGQLTNWLVTQTDRFKAAIPWAGISNLVSHNYMSVYHDYLQQEYFGKPHENGIMDMLWSRSPIRFVDRVKTPVMLSHGDNDLLVNPAEDEQYFIALRDVGVEAVMLRYPREGHGMREPRHLVDFELRSLDWYRKHFDAP